MPQSALTPLTQDTLRAKLDGIVSRMVADGQPDEAIRAVVGDFKGKYYVDAPPESPSMLELAGTTLGRAAKSIVSAPVNLARSVGGALADTPREWGPMGGGMMIAKRLLIDPAMEQGRRALDAGRQGRYSEAAGHGLAAALPVVGPAAASIGDQLGTGDPNTMAEGAGDLLAMAAAPAVMRGTGRAVSRAGDALQSGGRSAWLRAAKIPESASETTNTFRKTGDLAAAEQEIANTVLGRGRGALTRSNSQALNAERQAANQQIGQAVDTIDNVPSTPVLKAMANEVRRMRREQDSSASAAMNRYEQVRDAFSETVPTVVKDGPVRALRGPQTATESAVDGFGQYQPIQIRGRLQPRNVSGRELQDFNLGTGKRNANRFAARGEPAAPAVSRVDMAGGAAGRASMRARSPELARASDTSSALKPAVRAVSSAVKRAGHHDPIGLTQAVLGVGGAAAMGPLGGLMAVLPMLQRAGLLSRTGQAMFSAGGAAGRGGAAMSQANQAAVLAQLLNQDQQQP